MLKKIPVGKILLFFLLIGTFSCEIIDPPEKIPAYLKVDTIQVVVNDIDQGSSNHNLSNCWISVGGENLGVYQIPFTVPTYSTGFQTINIRGGIRLNGIAASRIAYPFFKPMIIDKELREGEVYDLELVTEYKEECVFAWMESFEDAGVLFEYPDYTDTVFKNQTQVVFEGRSSGAFFLDTTRPFFEAWAPELFDIPQNATPVILEFDYKTNNGFEIGMYKNEDGAEIWTGLVFVKPIDTWNRFYVDIGTAATYEQESDSFRPAIRATYAFESDTLGETYLDNLKLIHY